MLEVDPGWMGGAAPLLRFSWPAGWLARGDTAEEL